MEVEIQQVEWATYLEDLDKHKFQAYAGLGWSADYPDPQDFLDILFHSKSSMNHGAYSNSEVDKILDGKAMQGTCPDIWDGHTFPLEHSENNGEDDPFDYGSGHLSNEGYLKIAKAMWWLLARIAGWDGCEAVYGDLNGDCRVNMNDFNIIASHWFRSDCQEFFACDGADLYRDSNINVLDIASLAKSWLEKTMPCVIEGDINCDSIVNLVDFEIISAKWFNDNCADPNWCDGTDINRDNNVNLLDLKYLSESWLRL